MSIHICGACGKPIPDDASFCPHCGAEQLEDIRLTKIPETIEQLRAFCAAHQMPLEKMRFFIGENYTGARAFGIYKDKNGNCVVYKNKADGSRSIRYQGPDEKRAVRELYEKLKAETDLRRDAPPPAAAPRRQAPQASDTPNLWELVMGGLWAFRKPLLIILIVVLLARWGMRIPDEGYYRYQGNTYCFQNTEWFLYDDGTDEWARAYDVPDSLVNSYSDYFESEDFDSDYGMTAFSYNDYYGLDDYDYDSSYYDDDYDYSWSSYDDDWGSSYDDYDWDDSSWDSWDSWDSDWGSDW